MQVNKSALDRAEKIAADGGSIEQLLLHLRQLPLDDFGSLMFRMPDPAYPALSRKLPSMAEPEIQLSWSGASGVDLLRQSAAFMRLVDSLCRQHKGSGLDNATVMDFGCGYGRLSRLLYYFTNPAQIWGFDAWDSAIKLCRLAKLPGRFMFSDVRPQRLPTSEFFDIAFAYSVFSHLPAKLATACLSAVHRSMKPGGLFILTIRPVEFWRFFDKVKGTTIADLKETEHARDSVAFHPHQGRGDLYGEASYRLEFFRREGWKFIGYDRLLTDPFEIVIVLQAS